MGLPYNDILGDPSLSFGQFRLLPHRRVLLRDGRDIKLGYRAFDLLAILAGRAGEVIGKQELISLVWPNTVVEEANLRVHIAALRRALDGDDGPRHIEHIAGHGYRFIAAVERAADAPQAPADLPSPGLAAAPPPPVGMVGRAGIIAALAARLEERRLVSLVGAGGIGKTSVALAVAARLVPQFPVCFVDLSLLNRGGCPSAALVAALGLPVLSDDPRPQLLAHLRARTMLILLDNCEHVIEHAALLAEALLAGAPGVRVLATSRESLRAAGEWVQRLQPLDMPADGAVPDARQALAFSAVALFAERAAAVRADFALADADVAAVVDICRKLDGIPLAIELAAARVDLCSLRELALRLDDRFLVLNRSRRTALPRHRTLRAVMDWSHALLAPHEQAVLRRLALFKGEFSLASALALAVGDDIGRDAAWDALVGLTAKSLINAEASGAAVAYRLLDSTRAYAQEQLIGSLEAETLARRFAEHCRDQLADARADWDRLARPAWLALHGRRIDDVRAALDWCFSAQGETSLGVSLALASEIVWSELGLLEEQRALLEKALACLGKESSPDPRAEMQLQAALGNALYQLRGAHPATAAAYARAAELADALGEHGPQMAAFSGMCAERLLAGDYAAALALAAHFRAGPAYAAGLAQGGQAEAVIVHDCVSALALHLHGDQDGARRHAERVQGSAHAPRMRLRNGGPRYDYRVAAGIVLARVLWLQGHAQQAGLVAAETVAQARAAQHAMSLCYALAVAAIPVAVWSGDCGAARAYLAMLTRQTDEHPLCYWNGWQAGYRRLLERDGPDAPMTPQAAPGPQGENLASMDADWVQADTLARVENGEAGWCAAELLRVKGDQLLAGRLPLADALAEQAYLQALDVAQRQRAPAWALRAAESLARLWHRQGRSGDAARLLDGALASFGADRASTRDLRVATLLLRQLREHLLLQPAAELPPAARTAPRRQRAGVA
jgi:predicted ATPase/DNA-binding winged helix-turn-helix (wHTH) protein